MSKFKSTFEPNTVISLGDVTDLPILEDKVEDEIAFDATASKRIGWISRVATKEFLRPPNYNGRFTDIEMVAMSYPIDEFEETIQQKKKFAHGSMQRIKPYSAKEEFLELLRERTQGFHFSAQATSAGRGIIDQINTKIWYTPDPGLLPNRNGSQMPVNRVILVPEWNDKRYTDLQDTSRKIAFQVLREQMRNPISTPMQD